MRFIESRHGRLFSEARIESFGDREMDKNGRCFRVVTLSGGDGTFTVDDFDFEVFIAAGYQVIPAQPGTCILQCEFDGDEPEVIHRVPVIAWRLSPFGPTPVTVDGDNDGVGDAPVVSFPSGYVAIAGDRCWPTEEAYFAEQRVRQARHVA